MQQFGIPRRELSEAITRHKRENFSGKPVERAYLIGLRLGDLWVRKNKPGPKSKTIVVSCHTTRLEQLDLIHSLFSAYGHVQITHPSDDSWQILCYLNSSFEFLLPKDDRVPAWVLVDSSQFLAFLAGYVDAEGSFCIDCNGRASFQLKSCDIGILNEISAFLNSRLGLSCHPPRLAQSRGSPTGRGYRLKKEAWVFSIGSKQTLNRFCVLIKPYLRHRKRKGDLENIVHYLESGRETL